MMNWQGEHDASSSEDVMAAVDPMERESLGFE
jgi:hypothetical protein